MLKLLDKIEADVTTFTNGLELFERFKSEPPHLVLMDIQMPILDGVQTTRKIREFESPTGPHVPIIAVTGHALRGDRERFLKAGMDEYLPEPIDVALFFRTIQRFSREVAKQSIVRKYETGQEHESPDTIVNLNDFLERVGHDEELVSELFRMYLNEARQLLEKIEAAIRDERPEDLERSAHSLKGMSANLSAVRVQITASMLEDMGESRKMLNAGPLLENLRDSLEKTETYIQGYLNRKEGIK